LRDVSKAPLNIAFLVIAALCLWGVASSRAPRSDYVISVGILASQDDEDYAGALALKKIVEERSNGRIGVDIYTSGQFCGGERECVESLQSGVLDAFMTTFGGFGNFFGEGQAFELPYMFDSDATAECVLDGPLVGALRDDVLARGLGLRLMTVGNTGGWRDFATVAKPVRTPSDLKGLKIRTTPAQIEQEMVRTLGANPTPIAWSELYLAMATGVVDGTKNSIQDIVGMRLDEHVRYVTLDNHAYMGAMWWYSDKRWRELPPDLQAVLEEGFAALKQTTRALPKERQAAAFEKFTSEGGTIYTPTEEERAAFRASVAGMRDWYVERYGGEWLARLDAAVAACGNPA
jgi:tripartite ATP-independent transporter DctP family solute receptor